MDSLSTFSWVMLKWLQYLFSGFSSSTMNVSEWQWSGTYCEHSYEKMKYYMSDSLKTSSKILLATNSWTSTSINEILSLFCTLAVIKKMNFFKKKQGIKLIVGKRKANWITHDLLKWSSPILQMWASLFRWRLSDFSESEISYEPALCIDIFQVYMKKIDFHSTI